MDEPAPRSTLSLCVIARNEEPFLAGCLESVAHAADEIIVVDTGSDDRTSEIARTFRARVTSFEWCDDFSMARNVTLDLATCDFVLVLDADERLDEGAAEIIRRLIDGEPDDGPPCVYLPLIINVAQDGRSLGADHMARLWRRRPELRFTGRIHEEVGVGVVGLVRHFVDDLRIIHLGYDPSVAAARGKHTRNLALLEAALAEHPGDPKLLFYVARQRYAQGDDAAALELYRQVIADGGVVNLTLSAYVFAAECLRTTGDSLEALATALEGTRTAPDYGELWYVAGKAALDVGRPIQAEALFERAKQEPCGVAATAFRDPSIIAWRAEVGRSQALQAQNRVDEAVGLLERLRAEPHSEPDQVEIDLQRVDAALQAARHNDAWVILEPLLDRAPEASVPALLEFINLYVETLGVVPAYRFIDDCLAVHPALMTRLEPLGAAAELAEMMGDSERQIQWLRHCVRAGSPIVQHYLDLATLLVGRGELEAAEAAARAAQRLLENGSSVGGTGP